MVVRSTWLRPDPATLLLAAVAVVLVGSLVPLPTTDGVAVAGPLGIGPDKIVHTASYAAVAGLAAASRDWRRRGLAVVAVIVAVAAFGAGVEVAQSVVPGRTMSGADAVANAVGAAVGVVGWWLFDRDRLGTHLG